MKLALNSTAVLVFAATMFAIDYSSSLDIMMPQNQNLNILMMKTFGVGPLSFINKQLSKEIQRRQQKNQMKYDEMVRKREKEEEKRRKIINERLMPLTNGNIFMRDFYSGRY